MKTTRKLLSLVLALMMLVSLSVTAFADGTAYVQFYVDDEPYTASNFYATAGQSVMAALKGNADLQAEFGAEFTDYYGKPANALISLMGASSMPVDGSDYGIEAVWSTTNPGYGLVSVDKDADGNITSYNYVYTGYDWTYAVANFY